MRISDWSSDVCSSDLVVAVGIAVVAAIPVAAVAVADAQPPAAPGARVAVDAAVGRTVAVVVIIDRRLAVVVVAVTVPVAVTGGAAGKGDGGEDENKMSEHGGVPCLSECSIDPGH